jgi:hypothetical protein
MFQLLSYVGRHAGAEPVPELVLAAIAGRGAGGAWIDPEGARIGARLSRRQLINPRDRAPPLGGGYGGGF